MTKQAIGSYEFDSFVFEKSGMLDYENLKVLDIGCSNGFQTELLFDKYDNIKHITGIDIDEKAITIAKEKFKNNENTLLN